jgi:hypothetical protein
MNRPVSSLVYVAFWSLACLIGFAGGIALLRALRDIAKALSEPPRRDAVGVRRVV